MLAVVEKEETTPRTADDSGLLWYGNKISVTSMLSNAVANPGLNNWFKKNSEKKIEEVRTRTSNFGTDAHKFFEKILKKEEVIVPDSHQVVVNNFRNWANRNEVKPLFLEHTLESERLGVAGTTDFIGYVKGNLVVADWKTSTRYNITNGWQIAFYRLAAIEKQLIPSTTGMMGVQINRETGEIKTFEYEHIEFCEHAFLCALEVFKALNFHKLKKAEWAWLNVRAI